MGIICNGANDICWNNMCSKCKDAAKFRELYVLKETDYNKCCTWYQGEKVVGDNKKEYLEKVEKKEELMTFPALFQNLYLPSYALFH